MIKKAEHIGIQLLEDPSFERGFDLRSPIHSDGGVVYGRTSHTPAGTDPAWSFAQWGAVRRVPCEAEILAEGVYRYAAEDTSLTVIPALGEAYQRSLASVTYKRPRVGLEQWLHSLLEQSLGKRSPRISELSELYVTGEFQLARFEDHMGESADYSLHCAQYPVYLNLQNLTRGSADYGSVMHFGLQIFDNRAEFTTLYRAKDTTTPNYIYSIPNTEFLPAGSDAVSGPFFRGGKPFASTDGEWLRVDFNILPYMLEGFADARSKGFLPNTALSDLRVAGFCPGWEIPGTYDVEMRVRGFGIYAV